MILMMNAYKDDIKNDINMTLRTYFTELKFMFKISAYTCIVAEIIFSRFISKGVGRKAAVCWRNSIKHNLTECMSVSMEYKTYFNLKWFPTKISKIIFVNPRQVKKQKLSCQF